MKAAVAPDTDVPTCHLKYPLLFSVLLTFDYFFDEVLVLRCAPGGALALEYVRSPIAETTDAVALPIESIGTRKTLILGAEMTWEYRVMKRGDELAIYEVYYLKDGTVQGPSA